MLYSVGLFQRSFLGAILIAITAFGANEAASQFVNFETPQVHPMDLSLDGAVLAVCNTADNRVELFSVESGSPEHIGSVPVGLEPVSARWHTEEEVWVVNQISDTISIVNLNTMNVIATLDTLDEPADVIISAERAFVSCSQANTIQVFNAITLQHLADIPILGEDPRALALSPGQDLVYAAIFESGNRSTVLSGGLTFIVPDNLPNVVGDPSGPYSGVNPPPNNGASFEPAIVTPNPPRVGLIVKKNDTDLWMDDNNGDWTNLVSGASAASSGRVPGWDVVDNDVAIIDVTTLQVVGYIEGMMNINMAIATNPVSGDVSVVGTDATNEIRYEPNLTGTFLRVNIGIAAGDGSEAPSVTDLNFHLDYNSGTVPQSERDKSIGDPRAIAWLADASRVYVAGMGSNNVLVIDPRGGINIPLPFTVEVGEGPTGLVLDEARSNLYVLNRFSGTLSVIDLNTDTVSETIAFYDPTPDAIKVGRKHLYDTHKNSGLGQIACASCHVDARMDRLAWDVGDPTGAPDIVNSVTHNLGSNVPVLADGLSGAFPFGDNHPMKGPMSTQTFQNIIGKEPFHWRGDRAGLEAFAPAFMGLQGDDTTLTDTEMQEFKNFLETIHFPPNPFRNFDNSLPTNVPIEDQYASGKFAAARGDALPNGDAQRGLRIFMGTEFSSPIDLGFFNCVTCHSLPIGNGADTTWNGTFFEEIPKDAVGNNHVMMVSADGSTNPTIKVPHLRNVYDKVGMDLSHAQSLSGFGFLHDGTVDSVASFVSNNFNLGSDQDVSDLVALLLAFSGSDFDNPTQSPVLGLPEEPVSLMTSQDAHAAIGTQITVASPFPSAADMILINGSILLAQQGKVDLVVKGIVDGTQRGWILAEPAARGMVAMFQSDIEEETATLDELIALANLGTEITFTVVPEASGIRIGIDRDLDGAFDTDEVNAGSNPANPRSTPGSGSGGGCFIATAAYGTPLAEDINVLRTFRDQHLMTNALGMLFADTYYRLSPPIAERVAAVPAFAKVLRTGLSLLFIAPWLATLSLLALGFLALQRLRCQVR